MGNSYTKMDIDNQKKNKHLICDDESINRLVLKKYLTYYGCDSDEACDGLEAIEKVKNNGQYNVIWMDIKMPKMNGLECTKYLRNKMNYIGPIIGLTGYVDEYSINQCHHVGMNTVLSKPFDCNVIKMICTRENKN